MLQYFKLEMFFIIYIYTGGERVRDDKLCKNDTFSIPRVNHFYSYHKQSSHSCWNEKKKNTVGYYIFTWLKNYMIEKLNMFPKKAHRK